ncbi:MAG: hypothetical protein HRT43_03760 [Campylobacteraceae bacterium]|nr:hypothetical protein [Campylobacteraceae bacterium]
MNYFKVPEFLHDVFGEKQSFIEVFASILFALIGSLLIYNLFYMDNSHLSSWKIILGFILIADVLAGCIANFSKGTNNYYSKRAKNRLIFISMHIHIIVIAWALEASLESAVLIWIYTIIAASIVNFLKGSVIQGFIAANLLCYGIFLLIYLTLPIWFLMVSLFFMMKVIFSFAVDHFNIKESEGIDNK